MQWRVNARKIPLTHLSNSEIAVTCTLLQPETLLFVANGYTVRYGGKGSAV